MASKYADDSDTNGVRTTDIENFLRVIEGNDQETALQLLYESCGWSPASHWQKPITEYGDSHPVWKDFVALSMKNIGQFEIDDESFERAGRYTNAVLALMFKAMTENASRYTGLVLEGYSYQGSSRDGLKVISPNEFDTMLTFHIESLGCVENKIEKDGKEVAGFCYIRAAEAFTMEQLEEKYPELYRCGIFEMKAGSVFISSRKLHQCIFESIVDKSIEDIVNIAKAPHLHGNNLPTIKCKMNPPSINIVVEISDRDDDLYPNKI
ncbi:uncharacterized protein LOC123541548 [Mercenaria mercenaria]|uniref:uncharacterized protein LOC123541548 n=1 Tax=Mercenaria mercenaria TaxID=6596 RepID=UPI00234FA941|nr:uncharacterized protein LOC123541548 [Mercenaria mercenaria]